MPVVDPPVYSPYGIQLGFLERIERLPVNTQVFPANFFGDPIWWTCPDEFRCECYHADPILIVGTGSAVKCTQCHKYWKPRTEQERPTVNFIDGEGI